MHPMISAGSKGRYGEDGIVRKPAYISTQDDYDVKLICSCTFLFFEISW